MNTLPTHLVINAALAKKYGARWRLYRPAFLWGAVAPDIPLGILTAGFLLYNRYLAAPSPAGGLQSVYDQLYFHHPAWIVSHNLLHAPAALGLYAALLWRYRSRPGTRGQAGLSFVLGCLVHSGLDILTHYNDGPLLFFPFDWQTRFNSPVSYWDRAHFGAQFVFFEAGLNFLLLVYLFLPGLLAWLAARRN